MAAAPRLAEGWAVLLAIAGWIGADLGWSMARPRAILLIVVPLGAMGLSRRRPAALLLAGFLLCSHLGARADAGYHPLPAGPLDGPVTVLGDPQPVGAARRLLLRLPSGHRVEATAYGRAASVLDRTSIGETLLVSGRLRSVDGGDRHRSRHITGLAAIDEVEVVGGAGPLDRIPEFFRDRIAAGASTMGDQRRSLYLGLVIGDDRSQSLGQQLRFRASGLTHLLAVSGQNVAFVLAVARPLLQMLGHRGRFAGMLVVLVVFALITRLEPSVLRATTTASIAAWAAFSGRERSGLRVLSVAVVVLLCIDPFLVDSVGFQLSVAASTGILLLQPAIERRIGAPPWLAAPLATTLSAQIGVSPLLAHYFGPISLASVPANVLAGWAAAAIMTLGLSVGVLAAMTPQPIAAVLQAPTGALLWWIEAVATWHARLPAPRLGPIAAMGLAGLAITLRSGRSTSQADGTSQAQPGGAWASGLWAVGAQAGGASASGLWAGRATASGALRSRAVPAAARIIGLVAGLAILTLSVPRAPATATVCGPGAAWYPATGDGPTTLVLSAQAGVRAVEECRAAGIGRVDLLVVERGSARSARLVSALREVMRVGTILAPPQHRVIGARRQLDELRIPTSNGVMMVVPSADGRQLMISIGP